MEQAMGYLKLDRSQKEFVKTEIAKSAKILKRWTSRMHRLSRRKFRMSVFSNSPDTSMFPGEEQSLIEDAKQVVSLKVVAHEELHGLTVEHAFIEAYTPLFRSWCKSDADLLQAFLAESLEAIYSFDDPSRSLIEYLKVTFRRFLREYIEESRNFIRQPERWGAVGKKYDMMLSSNPHATEEEIIKMLGLSAEDAGFLKSRNSLPKRVFLNDGMRGCAKISSPCSERLADLRKLDLDKIGLSEVQKKCVDAFMHHKNWKVVVSQGKSSDAGCKPSKVVGKKELEKALCIIKNHLEEVA